MLYSIYISRVRLEPEASRLVLRFPGCLLNCPYCPDAAAAEGKVPGVRWTDVKAWYQDLPQESRPRTVVLEGGVNKLPPSTLRALVQDMYSLGMRNVHVHEDMGSRDMRDLTSLIARGLLDTVVVYYRYGNQWQDRHAFSRCPEVYSDSRSYAIPLDSSGATTAWHWFQLLETNINALANSNEQYPGHIEIRTLVGKPFLSDDKLVELKQVLASGKLDRTWTLEHAFPAGSEFNYEDEELCGFAAGLGARVSGVSQELIDEVDRRWLLTYQYAGAQEEGEEVDAQGRSTNICTD